MATFATSQLISRYYSDFQKTELTFTKDIIKTLALDPRQVYIKCAGNQWPCILNSASFSQARILVGIKGGAYQVIAKKDPPPVNIRLAFYQPDGQMMSFFVAGKVASITPYANNADLAIVTVSFTQRPPDDMIEIMGRLLDALQNSIKRKDDRIVITPESMRKLGIPRKENVVVFQNVPRNCILQELTFGGAKIVLVGIAQFLVNKEVLLRLEFDDPHEVIPLQGVVTGTLPVEGRKDIVVANIQFSDTLTPLAYKVHLNNYMTTVVKKETSAAPKPESKTAAPQASSPAAEPAQQASDVTAQESVEKEASSSKASTSAGAQQ